ncbi:MAG TPA: GNAT family N-acetyltransferase [Pyrinomonadaceae bacterium]|nr:GNAT family N-acetyltransferase [Pyrinomonadaceae bacterium]
MASVAYKFEGGFIPQQQQVEVVTSSQCGSLDFVPAAVGMEDEILSALAEPTLTNVVMAGFIRDHGLVSPQNRGHFYICRNQHNELEGVALIGHSILFEAFSETAIQGFTTIARRNPSAHLLMGEHNAVQRFWSYYADNAQSPRHVCPVLFLRRSEQFQQREDVSGLRLARPEDLEAVVRAQAAMALEMSGVDPLRNDPVGFRQRYLRRIDKNRVWVLMNKNRLIFKLDVITSTPGATYIEGVYVSPEERGKGLGQSCLTTVGQKLLEHTAAIQLFVETENTRTTAFYLRLGFNVAGQYDLLYF